MMGYVISVVNHKGGSRVARVKEPRFELRVARAKEPRIRDPRPEIKSREIELRVARTKE